MPEPDPMAKWTPVPDWRAARLSLPGVAVARAVELSQTLLTGKLEAALASLGFDAATVGLWEIAAPERAAIRIGRDRALLVSEAPLTLAAGWRDAGFAASDASEAYAAFTLQGAALRDLVAEQTSADVDAGSPSAAVLFAGLPALLYRIADDTARLHVEAPFATHVWRTLETSGEGST